MSGGQAGLRTAAITLGLAMAIIGVFSLIHGVTTRSSAADPSLRFSSASPLTKKAATSVSLGPLETDDPPLTRITRKMATTPTQLTAQIELDEFPPPPAKPTDTNGPDSTDDLVPRKAPAAELMDVEPMPDVPQRRAPECCERQEQQLARIALGLELLARQAAQAVIERAAVEPVPVRTETFITETDRAATAVIKIERTAEDRDRFSLGVHAAPVSEVFRVLCDLAGLKLEMAPAVTERVTLTLRDVTLGEAINAVLQHTNLGVERDEHLLRVMPRPLAEDRALRQQPLVTKIYRPELGRMVDVLPLVRPVLTPRIGRVAVMPDPAGRLCPDNVTTPPCGPSEILVIVDRAEVHTAVAKLLKELDDQKSSP